MTKKDNKVIDMETSFHHVHLFASDLEKTIEFYKEMFGAEILFEREMAGARNVLIDIGGGKINFYDQAPETKTGGIVDHLGIETDDLEALMEHMEKKGFEFENEVKDLGTLKYVMAEGPDNVTIELFERDVERE